MATDDMFSLLGIRTLSWRPQHEAAAGLADGYLSVAIWDWEKKRSKIDDYINSFETTIEVPRAPRKKDKGLIYIFMGLETTLTSPVRAILQPVLQWGSGPAGGGPHWSLVSCYVAGDITTRRLELAVFSGSVRVASGERITSRISLLDASKDPNGNMLFQYSCEFDGASGTRLTVGTPKELVMALEALEGYRLASCSALPEGDCLSFENIKAKTASSLGTPNWDVKRSGVGCGMSMDVKNSTHIDILYEDTP